VYFGYNLFSVIMKRLNVNAENKGMTLAEWNIARKVVGKPRRFSQAFVNQELDHLNVYRERARIFINKRHLINDGMFPKELTNRIQTLNPLHVVGRRVTQRDRLSSLCIRYPRCCTGARY
jgi:hypothetical protein